MPPMTNVDQFESMFRSASREPFSFEPQRFDNVVLVTDLESADAKRYADDAAAFLTCPALENANWTVVDRDHSQRPAELLALLDRDQPHLVCTYRNLHSRAWEYPYSLGTHLDLMTQHTRVPVLVLPHPEAARAADHALTNTDRVMAMTDHISGDAQLVNVAASMSAQPGTLYLTHIEDEQTLARYLDAISKIAQLDTDTARAALPDKLLHDAREYIETCANELKTPAPNLTVEAIVQFGHHISDYKELIANNEIDLLVLNTTDEDQLAMHGISYELAVELRQIPLLML